MNHGGGRAAGDEPGRLKLGELADAHVAADVAKRALEEAIVSDVGESERRRLYDEYLDALARLKVLSS